MTLRKTALAMTAIQDQLSHFRHCLHKAYEWVLRVVHCRIVKTLLPAVVLNNYFCTLIISIVNDHIHKCNAFLIVGDRYSKVKKKLHSGTASTVDSNVESCISLIISPVSLEGMSQEQYVCSIFVAICTGRHKRCVSRVVFMNHCSLAQ